MDAGGVNKVMFTDQGTSLADVDAGAKLDKLSIAFLMPMLRLVMKYAL